MNNVDKIKKVIDKYFPFADCGIFNTKCSMDTKECIYKDDDIKVLLCRQWNYLEVLGLSRVEWDEVACYYDNKQLVMS